MQVTMTRHALDCRSGVDAAERADFEGRSFLPDEVGALTASAPTRRRVEVTVT